MHKTGMRHILPYKCGVICLTCQPPDRCRFLISPITAESAIRSSARKNARLAAACVRTSGGSMSVHEVGNERSRPCSSKNITRSSPQVCLRVTSTKRLPRDGWNGWVTWISLGAPLAAQQAVLDLREWQG